MQFVGKIYQFTKERKPWNNFDNVRSLNFIEHYKNTDYIDTIDIM